MARLPIDIMTAGNRNELPTGQFSVEKATADNFGGQVGRALEGLGDAGLTRGTRRCGHPGDIEEEQEALTHSPGEQQVRVAGETPDGISEELGGRYSRTDPADETVAQQAQSGSLVLAFVLGELEGDGERGGSGYVLRTRAETALLRAATKHRRDAGGAGGDERSDADRGADLVSGETHRDESDAASGLAAQGAERQRHVPERGDGIEMEGDVRHRCSRSEGTGIVDRPGLVVGCEGGRERGTG